VLERKLAYVLIGGDPTPELVLFAGGDAVAPRVDDDEGGVRGRDPGLERFLNPISQLETQLCKWWRTKSQI